MIARLVLLSGLIASLVSACGGRRPETRLFVAASLAHVAEQWQEDYRRAGREMEFHSGGSSVLAQQIVSGAEADLFLSAGPTPLRRLQRAHRVARVDSAYLHNRIVLVCAEGVAPPRSLEELTAPRFARIALADPATAPAGEYTRAGLHTAGLWDELQPRMIPAGNVTGALAAVATGAADAAFVYATDAQTAPDLAATDFGSASPFPHARYVLVMLSPETPAKTALWDYLHTESAYAIAVSQGFAR